MNDENKKQAKDGAKKDKKKAKQKARAESMQKAESKQRASRKLSTSKTICLNPFNDHHLRRASRTACPCPPPQWRARPPCLTNGRAAREGGWRRLRGDER